MNPESVKYQRIGVLMGGLSTERSISLKTGHAIHRALLSRGYTAIEIDAGPDLVERIKSEKIDVAFMALHGTLGEDGCVQGLLEFLRIPYTGSGVEASAIAMDKRLTKRLLSQAGVPTPRWVDLPSDQASADGLAALRGSIEPLGFPLVVKPNAQGSTVGIHIVKELRQLAEAVVDSASFDDQLLLEQYIPGREVTVGILEGHALPVIEIVPKSGFFDFESKYTAGLTDYLVPAPIDDDLTRECQQLALETYRIVGCEGVSRVDIRIAPTGATVRDQCFVLEINTIPGMTETSLIPKAARHIGIAFEDVCERILAGARLKVSQKGLKPSR